MKQVDEIPIALVANHRYLPGLQATMASMILFASEKNRLQFNIFADALTDEDCKTVRQLAVRCGLVRDITFHHPDMGMIKSLFEPYNGSHAPFLRLFFCEYLDVDWVVYADVDTLWFKDVCELWNERLDGVSVLWCKDLQSVAIGVRNYSLKWNPNFDVERYACSGVMLMNLARMRTEGFIEKCAQFAKDWGTPFFVDQDILNTVCFNDAKLLEQTWDCMMPDRHARDACVLHFNGIGRMFNGSMEGYRPLYAIWYRFYYDVVLREPSRPECGIVKRILFFLEGLFYPWRPLIRFVTKPFGMHLADNIHRGLFFAWLRLHAKWYRSWGV